ncbi:DNA-binding protein RFX2 isoform X2 [Neocloeon triangulifer]|uniref:DNA-binding protein RFX2 isoform X2 n=1 Tax=Neocloeon triangulifer TaxID=2078957 RepID=UPI00286F3E89|nr:DNA-binding protein RFX2 isoform X2 [Neocloeon triangulifer]
MAQQSGATSPPPIFLHQGEGGELHEVAAVVMDGDQVVTVVPQQQQVATQTVLEEAAVDGIDNSPRQVTAQVVVSSAPQTVSVVPVSSSLSSSPVSGSSSPTAVEPTATQQFIAVTDSERSYASLTPVNPAVESGGVQVVTGDTVAHSTYVQYVDETPEAATIYTTTNGQMAYPVYTMGETTATMYTPAASGQYYSNQGSASYGQLLAQTPNTATYILQQGVDASEAHALISNRASPPTVSAQEVTGYMVPTEVTSNNSNENLDEGGSDSGGHNSLSHATRISPATVQWLVDNYETADGVSLPRSNLYHHYLRHCTEHKLDPVNAASFGKLIRSVFIGLRTRRLGTRGNSKYHYYGIRVKPTSSLAQTSEQEETTGTSNCGRQNSGKRFKATIKVNDFDGTSGNQNTTSTSPQISQHQQYLGEASTAVPDFPNIEVVIQLPEQCTLEDVDTFRAMYREHCEAFLDAVTNLEFNTVESLWRDFWRSSENNNDECEEEKYLAKRKLYALCECEMIQDFVKKVDFDFYQNLVEVLIPDVLRPIPSSLTQAIRNFAKGLEGWLSSAMTGCPEKIMNIKLCAVSAFAQTLRRYTSLNHLAQAARAVLQNSTQINQMLADLNRVDFHNVQEQASWVCQCDPDIVQQLEADFKETLQQQNSLEQWATWLKKVVATVLQPHEGKADFGKAARQFLLKWSFYSSMVIRDLTLRSAASFGSFHLIRLLYDEYMFYLIEHQVAQATGETPIAVIGEKQSSEDGPERKRTRLMS